MSNPFQNSGADHLFYGDVDVANVGSSPKFDYVSLRDDDNQERFPGQEEEEHRHVVPVSQQAFVPSQNRAPEVFPGVDEVAEEDWGLPSRQASVSPSSQPAKGLSELERREKELTLRERQLTEREVRFGQGGRQKNWPCQCLPLAYHSIPGDIPEDRRAFVRKLYALLLFSWLGMLWNLLAFVVIWVERGNYGKETLWAAGYVVMGIPGGWFLWYRSAYFGSKGDSTTRWIMFFVFFALHIGFAICSAVGIPFTNTSGLLLLIKFANHSTIFIFTMVSTCLWGLNTLLALLMMKSAAWHWKHGGGETALEKQVREEIARQTRAAAKKEVEQAWNNL